MRQNDDNPYLYVLYLPIEASSDIRTGTFNIHILELSSIQQLWNKENPFKIQFRQAMVLVIRTEYCMTKNILERKHK